jgi:hypothetical protein
MRTNDLAQTALTLRAAPCAELGLDELLNYFWHSIRLTYSCEQHLVRVHRKVRGSAGTHLAAQCLRREVGAGQLPTHTLSLLLTRLASSYPNQGGALKESANGSPASLQRDADRVRWSTGAKYRDGYRQVSSNRLRQFCNPARKRDSGRASCRRELLDDVKVDPI